MRDVLTPELRAKQEFLNGYYTTKYKYKKSEQKKTEEIERAIDALDNEEEKDLLRLRYIKNEKMDIIAMKMCISRMTAYRIHVRALRALEIPEGMVNK